MPTRERLKRACAVAGVLIVLAALGFACGGDEPPPVASFSLDVPSGSAPYTVQFMDTSQGPITSWQWDFGDGASSTEQNPTREYTVTGSSTVRLMVTPGGIDVTTLPEAINVDPGPLAEVVGSPTQIVLQVRTGVTALDRGTLKKCVNSQAVYPLTEQHGLKARERRY